MLECISLGKDKERDYFKCTLSHFNVTGATEDLVDLIDLLDLVALLGLTFLSSDGFHFTLKLGKVFTPFLEFQSVHCQSMQEYITYCKPLVAVIQHVEDELDLFLPVLSGEVDVEHPLRDGLHGYGESVRVLYAW